MNFFTLKFDDTKSKLVSCDVNRSKMIALAFDDKSGNLITSATNRTTRGHAYKWTIHAEEFLIRKLKKIKAFDRFKKISMLVLRYTTTKSWSMAKPCTQCQKLIISAGFNSVYYSNHEGRIEELRM